MGAGFLSAAYAASGPVHSEFSISAVAGGGHGGSSSTSAGPLPAEAPLDDLLQHVNHLISEFDRMYAD